jgi:Tripartite tricarboxylate transporter family receptor
MKLPRRKFLHLAAGAAALPAVSRMASAQTYPSRPISIIVPFPAGGATDVVARVLAKGLSDRLGQSVVVDNRPGANGAIGSASVARTRPDGHTLVMGGVNTHAMNDSLLKPRPYDSAKDFAPITLTAIIPIAFAVNPKLPVATLQELVDLPPSGIRSPRSGPRRNQLHQAPAEMGPSMLCSIRMSRCRELQQPASPAAARAPRAARRPPRPREA